VKARSSLLCSCCRRNDCRLEIDDAESCESAWREGASSRVREFMASRSDVLAETDLPEAFQRVGGRSIASSRGQRRQRTTFKVQESVRRIEDLEKSEFRPTPQDRFDHLSRILTKGDSFVGIF
jgi:hypothetical protein